MGDPAGAQLLDRAGTDGDSALGVGLGRLGEERLVGNAHDGAGDQDLALVQVDL
ncbi:MAG TPA: hypothetical protein VJ140_19375 [Actinomycetota bacterium]|nr:hypothetical protein [Actinomycetota bacterium]